MRPAADHDYALLFLQERLEQCQGRQQSMSAAACQLPQSAAAALIAIWLHRHRGNTVGKKARVDFIFDSQKTTTLKYLKSCT